MILTIYFTQFTQEVPHEMLQRALRHLPLDIQEKAVKFRRWQDAYACIFGKHLLKAALRTEEFPNDLLTLQYTPFGRPYLPGGPDFNISHSGNQVVCVISRQGRIGIDLEKRRPLDIQDFKSQFSQAEWESVMASPIPLDAFYDLWTARESLIKADGRGLSLDPQAIPHEIAHWQLSKIPFFPDYACHIATEQLPTEIGLTEISIPEFLLKSGIE